MTPRVAIVVVTYQSERSIGDALRSLRNVQDAGDAEIIIVDNNSTDRTRELLAEAGSWARIVHCGDNVGFGRGCNLGASMADAPLILFLNPDALMTASAIKRLADHMDTHPAAAIAGPAIHSADGKYQHAGRVPTPGRILRAAIGAPARNHHERVVAPNEPPFETTWVSGAALMVRRSVFEELGGFDPRFFLYFEETDLCKRARAAGHQVWAVGESRAQHAQGDSSRDRRDEHYSGCIAEHYFRSRFYYLCKHHGWAWALATDLGELVLLTARAVFRSGARRVLKMRLRGPLITPPRRSAT